MSLLRRLSDVDDARKALDARLAAPKRIQRQRTKGWRMPEGAIYVGRPTRWGNPFWVPGKKAGRHDGIAFDLETGLPPISTRHDSVRHYRLWLDEQVRADHSFLAPLYGHDLACWCPLDQPCHVDAILDLLYR